MADRVLEIFKDICEIPHGSGNEQKLVDYIEKFSARNNLGFRKDHAGNTVVCKNIQDNEHKGIIVLQAHLDMVCEKLSTMEHDFLTQGVEMYEEDGFLRAKGTTLGADNGIGVAMILAALESEETVDTKVAGLFTVSEEIGMIGAINMDPGFISGDILMSLDYGGEGHFCVGCAGGNKIEACSEIQYDNLPQPQEGYHLTIQGLKGGHSGLDIGKHRLNAIKMIIQFLDNLRISFPNELNVCEFGCSGKGGVIPFEAGVFLTFNTDKKDAVQQAIKQFTKKTLEEHSMVEPAISVNLSRSNKVYNKKFSNDTLEKVIRSINELPQGVIKVDHNQPEIIEASQNIDSIFIEKDQVKFYVSQRALDSEKLKTIATNTGNILEKHGFIVKNKNQYSGWRMSNGNGIVSLFLNEYKKMYDCDVFKEIVHAGLECGILSKKLGIENVIAFGASCSYIHTVNETVSISNIREAYAFLLHMLNILQQRSINEIR